MFVDTPDVVSSFQILISLVRFLRSLFELLFNQLHFTKEIKKKKKQSSKVTPYLPLFSSLKEYEYLPIQKKRICISQLNSRNIKDYI